MRPSTQVTDTGLGCLKGFPKLQELDLTNTPVTDAGLAPVEDLSKLQTFYVSETKVTDVGLLQQSSGDAGRRPCRSCV
jgi:Leucine Rich repeat